MDVYVNVNLRC